MTRVFLHIFNISITASWLIAAVLLVRWIIKGKTPRWVSCLLWAFVGLRLVIPFYFESDFSIIPSKETVIPEAVYGEASTAIGEPEEEIGQQNGQQNGEQLGTENSDFGGEASASPIPEVSVGENITADGNQPETEKVEPLPGKKEPTEYIHSGFQALDDRVNEAINEVESEETEKEGGIVRRISDIASVVWLCGVGLMLVYAVVNYLLLKKRVSVFVPEKGNIRRSENVGSPFILGFVRPKIYLPFGLTKETEEHIIAHELAHLNRRDHWIKPLGFALLSVYWFNPLVWVAYILLCRDIEYACDEKVVKEMGEDARKAYATALLECGVKRNMIAACPVAFGEIGVKDRVKSALSYKKPMLWIIIAAVVISAVTAGVFLLAPKDGEDASSADESSDLPEELDEQFQTFDGFMTLAVSNWENQVYLTTHKIESLDALETFLTESITKADGENGFKTFTEKLTEAYFDEKTLLVSYDYAAKSDMSYEMDEIVTEDKKLTVFVNRDARNADSEEGKHNIIVVQLDKSDISEIKTFEVVCTDTTNSLYSDVIKDFETLAKSFLTDTWEDDLNGESFPSANHKFEGNWKTMVADAGDGFKDFKPSSFGYAFKDINSDGLSELILMREDYRVLAVFTITSGEAEMLDVFYNGYEAIILPGAIYTCETEEDGNVVYCLRNLKKNRSELEINCEFGIESNGNDNVYYETKNGEREEITKERFDEILSEYPEFTAEDRRAYMQMGYKIEFIPFELSVEIKRPYEGNVPFTEKQFRAWLKYDSPYDRPVYLESMDFIIRNREELFEVKSLFQIDQYEDSYNEFHRFAEGVSDEFFEEKAIVAFFVGSTCTKDLFDLENITVENGEIKATIVFIRDPHPNAVLIGKMIIAEVDKKQIRDATTVNCNVYQRDFYDQYVTQWHTVSYKEFDFDEESPLVGVNQAIACQRNDFETFVIRNDNELNSFLAKFQSPYQNSNFYKNFVLKYIDENYFNETSLMIAYCVAPSGGEIFDLQYIYGDANGITMEVSHACIPDGWEGSDDMLYRLVVAEIDRGYLLNSPGFRTVKLSDKKIKLTVNGIDVDCHATFNRRTGQAEIPILDVLKVIGGEIQWQDHRYVTATMPNGQSFTFDTYRGRSEDYMVPVGSVYSKLYKTINGNFYFDEHHCYFLLRSLGYNTESDRDAATVNIYYDGTFLWQIK